MLETLIAIMLALGLTFTKTESEKISIDSATMSKLQQEEKFKASIPIDALNDIVVTDDDDPVKRDIEIK